MTTTEIGVGDAIVHDNQKDEENEKEAQKEFFGTTANVTTGSFGGASVAAWGNAWAQVMGIENDDSDLWHTTQGWG